MTTKLLFITLGILILLLLPTIVMIANNFNLLYIKYYILFAASCKSIYFIFGLIKQEIDFLKIEDLTKDKFIILTLSSIFVIILSYGIDYTTITLVTKNAFTGIPIDTPFFKLFFKMFYFSSYIFFWMGVSNILPNCTLAEYVSMLEAGTTFFILYYGTLNFIALKKEKS